MKKKKEQWTTSGICPICKQQFKSDKCPHSKTEALERIAQTSLEKLVDKHIKQALKRTHVEARDLLEEDFDYESDLS